LDGLSNGGFSQKAGAEGGLNIEIEMIEKADAL
jgi:hypothetical protein